MKIDQKLIWFAIGLGLVLFLVITTPGWQEVMGFDLGTDLGRYVPAVILLGFMAALVAFVLIGQEEEEEE